MVSNNLVEIWNLDRDKRVILNCFQSDAVFLAEYNQYYPNIPIID